MKIDITGASHFVNRMYEGCGNYQWARELLKNSLEAGASRIEFGIEWQAVEKYGTYRRVVADDGCGMTADELVRFFRTMGFGKKPIGGVHDNFGVGAKIASLPWNPEGLVVLSFSANQASMIWIVYDEETNDYELVEFDTDDGRSCVIDPDKFDWSEDIDWSAVAPDWVRQHGTVIVLLGSEEAPDTVIGNVKADEGDIKGLSVYLNTRFWEVSSVNLTVVELRSNKKNSWPLSADDRDDARRPNNRRILGARHYIESVEASSGRLAAKGELTLDAGRVRANWYLWKGERPAIHSYARKPGYIAVRYRDELFELSTQKHHFRAFGIVESQVQRNLTIILEPQLYEPTLGTWGVHPDQSRNRLIFTGNGEKGVAMPMSDWGLQFMEEMPDVILEAIKEARGDMAGSIENDEYRKRLQDKFGARWTIKRLVAARPNSTNTGGGELTDQEVSSTGEVHPGTRRSVRKRRKTLLRLRLLAKPDGNGEVMESESPVDVPRFRYSSKDEFEREWHLAMWCPHDPQGPTVVLNRDAPVLIESIKYHQDQYPDVYAEEIGKIVQQVYGEIAVAKIAHSQKLRGQVAEQELDEHYRSEEALTLALMGLLAEESLIAQRLGRLGRKKSAA